MILSILLTVVGLILLIKGGDWLVDGSVCIARHANLSPMVIGITILGFGTSAPELFVSLQAALAHSSELSIGNVVGSNIANIALILGATAIIMPCTTNKRTLAADMPIMTGACLMLFAVGMSGTISRIAGIIGMILLIIYTTWEIRQSQHHSTQPKNTATETQITPKIMKLWQALILCFVSLIMLVVGANLLINSASQIARIIGYSMGTSPNEIERIIGLTIVAVGTSLPELFASIMAARKGQTDMAVGNIIGSVTFNILCGIGLTAAICPIANSSVGFLTDYALMTGLALLLWLFMGTHRILERWEGWTLLSIYVIYVVYTVLI